MILTKSKALARRLPPFVREPLARLYRYLAARTPAQAARRRWLDDYVDFAQRQREYVFRSIARFCNINRPSEGYYFEFGCHGANTMRLAWQNSRHLFNWTYVGFDSFQGLPEIAEIDRQAIWAKGRLRTEESDFRRAIEAAGMPAERLITVKGFYDQSLTPQLRDKFRPATAAVIYVDCDLYQSTVPVLEFSKDFLRVGTVVVFDDWFCFNGDPRRGEQRAWAEFRARYPQLEFVDFVSTNEAKAFICIGTAA